MLSNPLRFYYFDGRAGQMMTPQKRSGCKSFRQWSMARL